MSGAFAGFSETDIKNVQKGFPIPKPADNGKHIKFSPKNKKTVKQMVRFEETKDRTSSKNNTLDIPEEAKLCKTEELIKVESSAEDLMKSNPSEAETDIAENVNVRDFQVPEIEKKPIDLDEFQARQNLIQEQNRRRKELLAKALENKQKQTREQTQRLKEIQQEFKKIDALLSTDVKLLRKRIEIASFDYMEAQKKYLRMEKEYLDAKLALQQKLEKKVLLTEHLSKIIEQNEERKAEKLTELLNKLEMSDIGDIEKCDEKASEQ